MKDILAEKSSSHALQFSVNETIIFPPNYISLACVTPNTEIPKYQNTVNRQVYTQVTIFPIGLEKNKELCPASLSRKNLLHTFRTDEFVKYNDEPTSHETVFLGNNTLQYTFIGSLSSIHYCFGILVRIIFDSEIIGKNCIFLWRPGKFSSLEPIPKY